MNTFKIHEPCHRIENSYNDWERNELITGGFYASRIEIWGIYYLARLCKKKKNLCRKWLCDLNCGLYSENIHFKLCFGGGGGGGGHPQCFTNTSCVIYANAGFAAIESYDFSVLYNINLSFD